VSPSSIYETLLIAYFGAGGQTEQELADVLVRNFVRNLNMFLMIENLTFF
jgi:serine protease inhibitor